MDQTNNRNLPKEEDEKGAGHLLANNDLLHSHLPRKEDMLDFQHERSQSTEGNACQENWQALPLVL